MKTKFIMSQGLAFAEDLDMKKLQQQSVKGWHVQSFKGMGYRLEKGEPADYIYNVDYRELKDGEKDEYVDLFSESGWSHVASTTNTHLFRATPGTKPIYSDQATVAEKHHALGRSMLWAAMSLVLLSIIGWVVLFLSTGMLKNIVAFLTIPLSIITLPAAWTVLTVYKNKWRAEGKKKKALLYVSWTLPVLIIGLCVWIYVSSGASYYNQLLAAMVIGATVGMSVITLVQKWQWKKRSKI